MNPDSIHLSLVIRCSHRPLISCRFAGTDLSSTLPAAAAAAASSRVPSLGLVLYLLKSSAADFSRFHQSHRQSLGKLQGLDQLPPEELKEVSCTGNTRPTWSLSPS